MLEINQPEWLFSRFNTKKPPLVPQVAHHRELVLFLSPDWVPSQAGKIYQGEASCHTHRTIGSSFTLLGPGQLSIHQNPQFLLCSQTSIPSLVTLGAVQPRCRTLPLALLRFVWTPISLIYWIWERILGRRATLLTAGGPAGCKSRRGMLMMYFQAEPTCLPVSIPGDGVGKEQSGVQITGVCRGLCLSLPPTSAAGGDTKMSEKETAPFFLRVGNAIAIKKCACGLTLQKLFGGQVVIISRSTEVL